MSGSVLIRSIDFTRSVGKRDTPRDLSFSDVVDVGGFPFEQKIKYISKIEVFSDTRNADAAVIVGLRIRYTLIDGSEVSVDRGLVNETNIGEFTINTNRLLVGVYGQLKNLVSSPSANKRVTSVSFVLFNKLNATLETKGPYRGSDVGLGTVWATFGKMISFQGTRSDGLGITSLGFVKDETEDATML